jgi:pilus assembly protein CpaE
MKVLLVEDDHVASQMLALAFTRGGYEVDVAFDGAEALAKIPASRPDIVVMDVMMPTMDGIEATRQLRARPATATIPIILLTAREGIQDKLAGLDSGADDYIIKPVMPTELIARVNALLRRAKEYTRVPAEERGRILGFLGAKGGVGTTTLAVNVSIALAQGSKRVILADLHLWTGAIALHLGLAPRLSVEQLAGKSLPEISARLIEDNLERHKSGVRVFAPPLRSPVPLGALEPEKLLAILDQLETNADAVIVDLGNGMHPTTAALANRCYSVILVLEADAIAVELAAETLRRLAATGVAGSRLELVVVSRSRSASAYTAEEIEQQLGSSLAALVAPAPEVLLHAGKTHTPVILGQPDALVALQLRELSSHLL